MAVGNFTLYDNAKLLLLNGGINMASDTIAVALLGAGYTPSASHDTWSDVSAQQIADADYAQKALTGQSVTLAGGTVTVDSADVSFGASVTITAKYAVLVKGTAGALAGTDKLIGYVDLNNTSGSATVSSTSGPFSVNTPNGLFGT